nr:hypothetical protein [Mycobacterium sp. IEC1808]
MLALPIIAKNIDCRRVGQRVNQSAAMTSPINPANTDTASERPGKYGGTPHRTFAGHKASDAETPAMMRRVGVLKP